MDQDAEHLKLLSIFYYVWAGLAAVGGCFPLIHLSIGLLMLLSPERMGENAGEAPPAALAWIFIAAGAGMSLLLWTGAVCNVLAGRFLKQRRHYIFCLVIAGLNCIQVPLGTVLGVFTFVVLMRDSVRTSFDGAAAMVEPLQERVGDE